MTLLSTIKDEIAREIPDLAGWCTIEKAQRMAQLVYESNAKLCVELGVFGGRALIAMSMAMSPGGRAYGIDPYTSEAALEGTNDETNDEWWSKIHYETIFNDAQEAIDRLGLSLTTFLVRKKSSEAVIEYEDGSIDILHQDSNHSEEVSCQEVLVWSRKIRPGGYWVFDDTNWPSTQKAQRMLLERGFTQVEDRETWKIYRNLG